ncbi:hypothetical protein Goklo_026733, partial [Gossypium klotzschianum]|nr:hypothetical protein [Gossypium klotzschianum]
MCQSLIESKFVEKGSRRV